MAKETKVTLEDALNLAKEHHLSGNLTLAERTYKDVLAVYPEDFVSLHYLAVISYQKNAYDDGITFMKRALEINENDAPSWNILAVMLELVGQIDSAIRAWEKAIKINPDYVDALSNYAHASWKMGDFEKTEDLCNHALKIQPDYFPAIINLGGAYQGQKNNEKALEVWKQALEIIPDNPNALINIGNSLRDLGRINESEEYCRKAIAVAPENPDALLNLANALADQGKHEEAEKHYKQATNIQPNHVKAHSNLAITLMAQFRYDEALASAKYAIAFDPSFREAYGHMAIALSELSRLDEAEVAARKAFALAPDSAEAHVDLGQILFTKDNYDEAATLYSAAMELDPDNPRLYLKLSIALERANKFEESIEAIDQAVKLNPEMPEAYHLKGVTYMAANQTDKALKAINKALEIKPDYAEAMSVKSEILQAQGDMEEATKLIQQAIRINNQIPSIYLTLSKLKKFTKDDDDLKVMEDLKKDIHTFGSIQTSPFYYSLFKAYQDIGDYDQAFENLKMGADKKRSTVSYDILTDRNVFETVKARNTKEILDNYKGHGSQSDTPIFIVGMPRSGTTLTEQILASHPDVYGAGELYHLTHIESIVGEPLSIENAKEHGDTYVKLISEISDESKNAKRITDKMPGNYARIGQIASILPNAKIIHCRRNPIDTCFSCYKQLFSRGHYWTYDLEELASHYELYHAMMQYWRETLPDNFIEVTYEDTINDFETQARRIVEYAGLEWNDACLTPHKSKRSVLTASKGQVRKPIYKTSIEAWRRYEKQLEPLASRLEKYVKN